MTRVRAALWALVAATLVTFGSLYAVQQLRSVPDLATPPLALGPGKKLGAPFKLTAHDGRQVTLEDFRTKPSAWFFGFTHCPEVCPAAMFQMSEYLKTLGRDAEKLNIVFVTVDPERDTEPVLRDYLSSFDPRIIGLTGDLKQVQDLANSFHIYFAKSPTADGGYTMDHTSMVILTEQDGTLAGTLDFHEPEASQLGKLRRLIQALQT